jgi:hypothetical protein
MNSNSKIGSMNGEMTKPVVGDSSEIVVVGKDMFGATFSEKAKLISLSQEEFSFSLYRPVSENDPLQVNFHPGATENCFWVKGRIVKVKNRLDGMQTVGVKVLESSVH